MSTLLKSCCMNVALPLKQSVTAEAEKSSSAADTIDDAIVTGEGRPGEECMAQDCSANNKGPFYTVNLKAEPCHQGKREVPPRPIAAPCPYSWRRLYMRTSFQAWFLHTTRMPERLLVVSLSPPFWLISNVLGARGWAEMGMSLALALLGMLL